MKPFICDGSYDKLIIVCSSAGGLCEVLLSSQRITSSRQQSERSQLGELEANPDSQDKLTATQNVATEEGFFSSSSFI